MDFDITYDNVCIIRPLIEVRTMHTVPRSASRLGNKKEMTRNEK